MTTEQGVVSKPSGLRVTEFNDLASLEGTWPSLLAASPLRDNIFLTWDWVDAWWRHYGSGNKMVVLMVQEDGKPLALAPMMKTRYRLPGLGRIRKIQFLGSPISDYHNFIIVRDEYRCLRSIVGYLLDNFEDCDWIELNELPDSSTTLDSIRSLGSDLSGRLSLRERVCNVCPYIPLPRSFDALMKGLDGRWRHNLNRFSRRIRNDHAVELKRYDEMDMSLTEAMDAFIKLHQMRWIGKGMPGEFKEASFREFHLDVARRFAEKDQLGLYFLTADGIPVSAEYNFEMGRRASSYLSGFDPAFSRYAVGNVTVLMTLDRYIRRGFETYDLLRGNEPYKFQWTSKYEINREARLVRRGLLSAACDWATWKFRCSKDNPLVNRLYSLYFRLYGRGA